MNIELDQNDICLKRNQVVRVRRGHGHTVVCASGSVWVTQEGDRRDVVLRAGEAFTLDRAGLALVLAFEPGAIRITRSAAQTGGLSALLKSVVSGAGLARRSHGFSC